MVGVQSHHGIPSRTRREMGTGYCNIRGGGWSVGWYSGRSISVEETQLTVNAQIRLFGSSHGCPAVRGVGESCGIVCIEVAPDQSVISGGEKASEFEGVVELAGTGSGNVDVDDS